MEKDGTRKGKAPVGETDAMYEFLARLLLRPMDADLYALAANESFWEDLAKGDGQPDRFTDACRKVASALASFEGSSPDEAQTQLATEYTRFFVGPENQLVPPWESLYQGDKHHLYGPPVAQVRAFMRKHGLSSVQGASWPEDHLGMELLIVQEFLGKGAIDDGDVPDIRAFIEEHPLRLVRAMNEKARSLVHGGSGFYRSLLELVEACLESDVETLRAA
ncbi:TorD/DmsD family molecular chaperone [Hugonella massiliensis]|uniref:TorD/DmsD family molecular chaperone n=1 Tax=Hugonella massiliensis TaxID=1720315 RepID=UPI00073E8B82|nr:molecular chaperone TorD family protein [Hugonella massiliensis]